MDQDRHGTGLAPDLPEPEPEPASAPVRHIAAEWVFAYGSLIWNPEFSFTERHRVRVFGYHRAFCISSTVYRGTPQSPGAVLGLDRGGSCQGIAYRLHPDEMPAIIDALYRREMVNGVYLPRMLETRLADGRQIAALAFVARRDHPSYLRLERAELMRRLGSCHGGRGPNRDYAINTWKALSDWGIVDNALAAIAQQLEAPETPAVDADRAADPHRTARPASPADIDPPTPPRRLPDAG